MLDRSRVPTHARRARAPAWALSGLALIAACGGQRAPESTDDPAARAGGEPAASEPEAVGQARQAVSTAQPICVTYQQGLAGSVTDVHIANKTPPANYAGSQAMSVGIVSGAERRSLVKFDLSAVPAHAVVQSARITLAIAATGPGTIEAHRITAPWAEATVTWQSFNNAYASTIEASASNGGATAVFDVAAAAQAWIDGAQPNEGLLFLQPGAYSARVDASEWPVQAERPKLDLCYAPLCAPGTGDCNHNGADGCETALTTVTNCGACGVTCSTPHATPTCGSGTCAIAACAQGFLDCNGDPSDGCETPASAAPLGSCDSHEGTAALSGGTTMRSPLHSGVFSLSGAPGGNHTASSPKHRLNGGVIGATQGQ